jgi:hypothetical protein
LDLPCLRCIEGCHKSKNFILDLLLGETKTISDRPLNDSFLRLLLQLLLYKSAVVSAALQLLIVDLEMFHV